MLVTLSVIAGLLFVSAFFSGSETALTAASKPVMHQLEQKGESRATTVNRLHARKERLLGAILLGNNLVNILASALATSLMIATFGEPGVAYATITMTLLILVFAEILPKTYAFKHANRVALIIAPAVNLVVMVLTPLTAAINALVAALLKLAGIDYRAAEAFAASDEELRGAIELHDGDDSSIQHERAMLRSVLDLGEVQVGEIMVHRTNLTAIDTELIPVQGTALGHALRTSVKAFNTKDTSSRAVILITDGEDQTGDALLAAKWARKQEVKVFAIGIGAETGAPIPNPEPSGSGFKKDPQGQVVLTKLDEATLQKIALETGGSYVRSVTGDMDLQKIYLDNIKHKVKKKEFATERRKIWQERFQWMIFVALIFLSFEFLRRKNSATGGNQR